MPKLRPLQEWVCDSCGDILSLKDGAVEWLECPTKGPNSFRIVHGQHRCYRHTEVNGRADMSIRNLVGVGGLQRFLSMLAVGAVLDPQDTGRVLTDLPSYTDTIRRLQIPYYEEARRYFGAARDDGYFSDLSEVAVFMPETCEAMIKRYEG